MEIKEEILKILTKNKTSNLKISHLLLHNTQLHHTDIEELDISDILYLCIPVINGKYHDQLGNKKESIEQYEDFIINIEDLNKWNKLSEIFKNMEDTGLISRNDKIYMYNIKKYFRFDYIDWEDREWIYSLIEYLFILCIEDIHILKIEIEMMKLSKNVDDEKRNVKNVDDVKHVDDVKNAENILTVRNIKRNDILVNRIKPKYTLDQFANKLMKQIEKKGKSSVNEDLYEKEDEREIEEDISNMRMKDEINDERHVSKGNTDNVG